MPSVEPGTLVTAHFQWVRQLTAGEAGKTQLDAHPPHDRARSSSSSTRSAPMWPAAARSRRCQDPSFRALMQTLRQQATSCRRACRHDSCRRSPTHPRRRDLRARRTRFEELYNQQVVPTCSSLIANRYPFASSATDVQLADFGSVFGYDGLFDKFFTDHLEKQVDTTGPAWTWRPGSVNLPRRVAGSVPGGAAGPRHVLPAGLKDAGCEVLRDVQRPRRTRSASCCRSTARLSTTST